MSTAATSQEADGLHRGPAQPGCRSTIRVDREHERGRHRDRAGPRRAARGRPASCCDVGSSRKRAEVDGDPDGHVDEEDPVPVERVGEHAAEEHAGDAAAAGGDEAEDAHRLRTLARAP